MTLKLYRGEVQVDPAARAVDESDTGGLNLCSDPLQL